MGRKVISLFDYTGNMVEPWREAGYECWVYDIRHEDTDTNGFHTRNVDLSRPIVLPSGPDIMFAFPPCTHLAVSGAAWFKGKGLRKLAHSIMLFATAAELCDMSGAPYLIENPVSTISTYWRKPDHIFHPHQYAGLEPSDNYTKKTCLWVGGGFKMPSPVPLTGSPRPDNRIHWASPGPGRADFRSATPMGFARAVFEANFPGGQRVKNDLESQTNLGGLFNQGAEDAV